MLTIEQVIQAIDKIEEQLAEPEVDLDKIIGELRAIRQWSNQVMMKLSVVGNRLIDMDKLITIKTKEVEG